MAERKHILVGLGEILWDILPDGKRLGGAPANFAYHTQALGDEGVVVSRVGNDKYGREILEELDHLGLTQQYVEIDTEHPTGTVTVKLDKEGSPDYAIHEKVAWDYISVNCKFLAVTKKADAVCFGSLCQRSEISRSAIRNFLSHTQPSCLRIFDVNFRQSFYQEDIVRSSLQLCNVLKLNHEELVILSEMFEVEGSESEILDLLLNRFNLYLIALTKGLEGSRLYAANKNSECRVETAIKIVDTVGAGDAFTAALAVGLLKGYDLDTINHQGNRVAGYVCTQSGATPAMPQEFKRYR